MATITKELASMADVGKVAGATLQPGHVVNALRAGWGVDGVIVEVASNGVLVLSLEEDSPGVFGCQESEVVVYPETVARGVVRTNERERRRRRRQEAGANSANDGVILRLTRA